MYCIRKRVWRCELAEKAELSNEIFQNEPINIGAMLRIEFD